VTAVESDSSIVLVPDPLLPPVRASCTTAGKCTAPTANRSLTCFGTELGYSQTSYSLSGLQKSWKVTEKPPLGDISDVCLDCFDVFKTKIIYSLNRYDTYFIFVFITRRQ
jgi:hypothetical protein